MPEHPLSLPRITGPVFVLDAEHLRRGVEAARSSPRLRIMQQVNRTDTEGVQRLVNFMHRGSYFRAHRHPRPECVENLTVVQGAIRFLTFDSEGGILTSHVLRAGEPASCMADIEQGVWHTLVPLADDTVVVEMKRGPYDAKTDKEFAPWSPAEGTAEAAAWLERMGG